MTKETLERANELTGKIGAAKAVLVAAIGDNRITLSSGYQHTSYLMLLNENKVDTALYKAITTALENYIKDLEHTFNNL